MHDCCTMNGHKKSCKGLGDANCDLYGKKHNLPTLSESKAFSGLATANQEYGRAVSQLKKKNPFSWMK